MKNLLRTFFIVLLVAIFINGCGSSSDGDKLRKDLNFKCSSINLNKMQANCSMAKRASADNTFCDSGIYDKMSDKEVSKEIRLLEKEAVDCINQKKRQDRWLW
tara:strand:- start:25 stop:333 length:309 start_codon:yes stop_codon:yes gene_type:complete